MKIETARLHFSTDDGASIADVTAEVNAFVRDSAFRTGLCVLTVPGDGCCLTLSADLDEDVDDLLRIVRTHLAVPPDEPSPPVGVSGSGGSPGSQASQDRLDVDDSGYPTAGIVADTLSLSIREGSMNLGSWESVVLLDGRGPRMCPLDVTLMGM